MTKPLRANDVSRQLGDAGFVSMGQVSQGQSIHLLPKRRPESRLTTWGPAQRGFRVREVEGGVLVFFIGRPQDEDEMLRQYELVLTNLGLSHTRQDDEEREGRKVLLVTKKGVA